MPNSEIHEEKLIKFLLKQEERILLLEEWNHQKFRLTRSASIEKELAALVEKFNRKGIDISLSLDARRKSLMERDEEVYQRTRVIKADPYLDKLVRNLALPFQSNFVQFNPELFLINGGHILKNLYQQAQTEEFRLYVLDQGFIWLESVEIFHHNTGGLSPTLRSLFGQLDEFFKSERESLQRRLNKN